MNTFERVLITGWEIVGMVALLAMLYAVCHMIADQSKPLPKLVMRVFMVCWYLFAVVLVVGSSVIVLGAVWVQ